MQNQNIEQHQFLEDLIFRANTRLEEAGRLSANRAFNLGCMVGLIPAIIVVLIAFVATRLSWLVALVTLILMLITLVGFANLTAITARTNAMKRVYQLEISPEIDQELERAGYNHLEFYNLAMSILPETAPLYNILSRTRESDKSTF